MLGAVGTYDGEEFQLFTVAREFFEVEGGADVIVRLASAVDSGFRLLTVDAGSLESALTAMGLGSAAALVSALRREGRVVELAGPMEEAGVRPASLESLARALGVEMEVGLADVLRELHESRRILRERGVHRWRSFTKYLRRAVERYLRSCLEVAMVGHLALEARRESRLKSSGAPGDSDAEGDKG